MRKKGAINWYYLFTFLVGAVALGVVIMFFFPTIRDVFGSIGGIVGSLDLEGKTFKDLLGEDLDEALEERENRDKIEEETKEVISGYNDDRDCDSAAEEFNAIMNSDVEEAESIRRGVAEEFTGIIDCYIEKNEKDNCGNAYEFYLSKEDNEFIDNEDLGESLFSIGICYKNVDEDEAFEKFEKILSDEKFKDLDLLRSRTNQEIQELRESNLGVEEREALRAAEVEIRGEYFEIYTTYIRGDYPKARSEFDDLSKKIIGIDNLDESIILNQYLANSIYFGGLSLSKLADASPNQDCSIIGTTAISLDKNRVYQRVKIVEGNVVGDFLLPISLKNAGDCYREGDSKSGASIYYTILLTKYRDSNQGKSLINELQVTCAEFANLPCNTKNQDWTNLINVEDINFDLRCYFEIPNTFLSDGICKSCTLAREKDCNIYGKEKSIAKTCLNDPCGFGNCKLIGSGVINNVCTEE